MAEYRMPSLGADMKDGRVVEWFVGPGDQVRRGDVVGVVDTAKGAIEMEIWMDAVVEEIVAQPGARVPVGEPLLRLRGEGEASAEREEAPPAMPPRPEPAARPEPETEVSQPREVEAAETKRRALRASPAARKLAADRGVDLGEIRGTGPEGAVVLADVEEALEAPSAPLTEPGHGTHVTPVARRMAEVHGIDLTAVRGTGPHDTVTRDDVEALVAESERTVEVSDAKSPPEQPPIEDGQRAMRDAIAAAMARSKREIPHYYLQDVADMEAAEGWLTQENASRTPADRILPVALLLKAVALAARSFPEMNGHFSNGSFHRADRVHLGLAVSLRSGGLVAPAIRDTDTRTVDDLSQAVMDVVQRARAGRLRSSEMTDATLTVSSLGERGVQTVFGVIYPPQVAIVGFGRVTPRPWAEDGLLGVRSAVTVTLAGDHRVSDGHRGGLFLQKVATLLTKPEEL
jgi:pyruvate dehydrogenase E2 component (dihydrolipoamide acetyltransferase)